MLRITAVVSAAAVVLMVAGLLAQAKPNFTGKWTMEAPAAPAAPPAGAPAGGGGGGGRGGGRGGGGGWGMEFTATQNATTLTIDYMAGGQAPAPVQFVVKLDGSESMNTPPGRGGAPGTPQPSKAMWTGATLVITTTTQAGETKRVLSMDGANLKIETTAPGFGGGAATTTTLTYKH